MKHVLGFIGIAILAGAAFYGVAYLAKRQMGYWFWQSGPDTPATKPGAATGSAPHAPK